MWESRGFIKKNSNPSCMGDIESMRRNPWEIKLKNQAKSGIVLKQIYRFVTYRKALKVSKAGIVL